MSGNIVTLPSQGYPSFLKEDTPENAEVDAIINKIWYMFSNARINSEKLKFFRTEILNTNIYVDEFEKFAEYWIRTKLKFFTISEFLEWHKIWLRNHPRKESHGCPYNICKSGSLGYIPAYHTTENYKTYILCRCHSGSNLKSTNRLSFEDEIAKLGFKIYEQSQPLPITKSE